MSPPLDQPPRYRTSQRTQLAAAAADSEVLNPHNLVDPWYPVWWMSLRELVTMFDSSQSLVVMDNKSIFLSSSGGSPQELAEKIKDSQARCQELIGMSSQAMTEAMAIWDGQLSSNDAKDVTAVLAREKALQEMYIKRHAAAVAKGPQIHPPAPQVAGSNGGALQIKPAFVVAHLEGDRGSSSDSPPGISEQGYLCAGYRMRHLCFPLVGEVKALPSRRLAGKQLLDVAHATLRVAESDLFDYLVLLFARDPSAQKVIAVSAAGVYWRWCSFQRSEVAYNGVDDTDGVQRKAGFLKKFNEAQCQVLGTEESDDELNTLWSTTLYPFLKNHPTYPPA